MPANFNASRFDFRRPVQLAEGVELLPRAAAPVTRYDLAMVTIERGNTVIGVLLALVGAGAVAITTIHFIGLGDDNVAAPDPGSAASVKSERQAALDKVNRQSYAGSNVAVRIRFTVGDNDEVVMHMDTENCRAMVADFAKDAEMVAGFTKIGFRSINCDDGKDAVRLEKRDQPPAVTAADLALAYNGNQLAAEAKYKGKRMGLSGEVEQVRRGITGRPNVLLRAGRWGHVYCDYVGAEARLANVAVGSTIVMLCTGDASPFGVAVGDCVLVDDGSKK